MRFVLAICSILLCQITAAQKVGLVLSGGGAKGLAHIGVIKALEENNIPIDYIVGTSMGGVIGGYYAAGYSGKEIEAIVTHEDFISWVNGDFGKKYNYFFTKREDQADILTVDITLDSTLKASFNTNLANDRVINFVLSEMLAQASEVSNYNFDNLFVPFRTVASDIFTQQQVIFRDGNLSDALRATFSIPLVYRPIKINGKYLFDGGIYNNFPVDIMEDEFDPEVIIGSNVSDKNFEEYPYDKDEQLIHNAVLYSIVDNSDPKSLEPNGVFIEPDLTTFNAIDFTRVSEIIDSGYVVTMQKMPLIKEKIRRELSQQERDQGRKQFKSGMKELVFSEVRFQGLTEHQEKFVTKLFRKKGAEKISIDDIKKGYNKLISEEYFRDLYPTISPGIEDDFIFDIYGHPKKNLNLGIGGAITTRSTSEIYLGIRFYHFNKLLFDHNLNFYTGQFYQSAQAKSRIILPVISQFYLEPEFTINKWDYLDSDDFFIEEKSPTPVSQIDRKYGLSIGMPLGTQNKLSIQWSYVNNTNRFSNSNQVVSTDTLDNHKIDGFRYGINFSKNSLNRKLYSNEGNRIHFGIDYFDLSERSIPGNTSIFNTAGSATRKWIRGHVELEQYIRFGKYSSGYYINAVFSNQPLFINYMATLINSPSFYPLQDSKSLFLQKFRAHNYFAGGVRNVFTVMNNLDLRVEGYFFKAFKNIIEKEPQIPDYDSEFKSVFFAATAGAVYHSPLGPISLSLNYYDDNETRVGVLLHLGYLIYNRRSLE